MRTIATLLGSLLLAAGAAAAQTPPIPDTVSPQARAAMERLAKAATQQSAFTMQPKTLDEWDARNRAAQAFVMALDKPVLDRLAPQVSEVMLGGVPALRVEPKGGAPKSPVLVYVHGGGFTLFSARSTLGGAAMMAASSGLTVYSIDYTVAPRGNWKTATGQVGAAYRALLAQGHSPKRIGMFGDSAGGNIVAASVLKLRDEGAPMPGALVLLSPVTDLTGRGDTRRTLAAADPMLRSDDLDPGRMAYAAGEATNPYVSPVYGDYSKGYPPTLIQAGTREILLSDAVRQYQAIAGAGGTAVLDVYEGMPHVFQAVIPGSPESDAAYRRAAAFWKPHLGR